MNEQPRVIATAARLRSGKITVSGTNVKSHCSFVPEKAIMTGMDAV